LREAEVEHGCAAPRILSLDDYFMIETESWVTDELSGRKVKRIKMEWAYEPAMEATYMASYFKAFKKTVERGVHDFVILDNVNNQVKDFAPFYSHAKQAGFEVYLIHMQATLKVCSDRNVHNWKVTELERMASEWEDTPIDMKLLDVDSLLGLKTITTVNMDNDMDEVAVPAAAVKEEVNDGAAAFQRQEDGRDAKQESQAKPTSRWEDGGSGDSSSDDESTSGKEASKEAPETNRGAPESTQRGSEAPAAKTAGPNQNKKKKEKKRVRWAAEVEEYQAIEEDRGFTIGAARKKAKVDSVEGAPSVLKRTKGSSEGA
jgi:YLP motif-containing protein 1